MRRCHVLVVEDDPELGELVIEALGMELDCELRLIADGSEARRWLAGDQCRANVPGMIILDIHLPGVSGLELLDDIRADRVFDDTRIVMTTADSMLLERARGKADWLLLKPVGDSHFAEISRWFRARKATGKSDNPAVRL